MSMTFYIKNKKKLFGYAAVLSVAEALQVLPDLSFFNFDENAEGFDKDKFMRSKLSDYACLLLGVEGLSGRGFEVGYEEINKRYTVRIFTPSTRADWQLALAYIKNLALKLGSGIINERDEEFTAQNIEAFDYEPDINAGLASMKTQILDGDADTLESLGVNRPAALDARIAEEIMNDVSPIDKFSEFLTRLQYLDAYSANQMFYRDRESGEIFGAYALTEGVNTILPFLPSVDFGNIHIVKNEDVGSWKISLLHDDENMDILDYGAFIEHLPKEKYKFIDARYILVSALNADEMNALVSAANWEKRD